MWGRHAINQTPKLHMLWFPIWRITYLSTAKFYDRLGCLLELYFLQVIRLTSMHMDKHMNKVTLLSIPLTICFRFQSPLMSIDGVDGPNRPIRVDFFFTAAEHFSRISHTKRDQLLVDYNRRDVPQSQPASKHAESW